MRSRRRRGSAIRSISKHCRKNIPKLEEIYSTTGECRIHCVGRSRNKSTMEAHVNYLFNHTKGIRKVSWHILMSDLRKGSVDAESKN